MFTGTSAWGFLAGAEAEVLAGEEAAGFLGEAVLTGAEVFGGVAALIFSLRAFLPVRKIAPKEYCLRIR